MIVDEQQKEYLTLGRGSSKRNIENMEKDHILYLNKIET